MNTPTFHLDRLLHALRTIARPGGGILHAGCGDGALVRALLADGRDARGVDGSLPLPFDDGQFATVVGGAGWLEALDADRLDAAIRELVRISSDVVVVEMSGRPLPEDEARRSREWWEERLLRVGLRRHTRVFEAVDFETLESQPAMSCLLMAKLPPAAAIAHPLESLRAERDLHMDMLREAGRRSDAHLARYEWARGWIKPGDVVVDAACGLGYGSAMLWDGSEAACVVGIDISESVVAYARDCFLDGRPGLEFRAGDAEGWDNWADNSVDCIVSFETLEHLNDPERFIRGAKRVLKPGGRFLCSVPNEWVDETGNDPNPWHLHVFTLDRLVEVVSTGLLVDEVYAESAGGHAARFHPKRRLRNIGWPAVDQDSAAGAEWWLLSGVKDPLASPDVPYVEQVFPTTSDRTPDVIAFARDYVNPWAVHALVLGCFRVRSPRLLQELAQRWLDMAPAGSADAGAALCILCYRHLDGHRGAEMERLLSRIDEYCARPPRNAQSARWQVSLQFAAGLLRMRTGELDAAEISLRRCAESDATSFAPHLETKTTEAAWLAGRLALERGDSARAAADWASAFAALERLKAMPVSAWLVTPTRPADFEAGDGLREIAVAIDNATLCANGLRKLADSADAWRPGTRNVERNLQRHISRLAAHAGEAWKSAGEGWAAAERAWVDIHTNNARWHASVYEQAQVHAGQVGELQAALSLQQARVHQLEHQLQELDIAAAARQQAAFRPRRALRIGIFGTGAGAMNVARALAIVDAAAVAWFADNNADCQGRTMFWVEVIAPAEIPRRPVDLVVIGSMSVQPIRAQLIALGIPPARIVAPRLTADACELLDVLRMEIATVLDSVSTVA